MANNCKIELNGYLGADPKSISKNGKTFIVLRVATTGTYPAKDEKTSEIKWRGKETIWHDVLVFRLQAAHFARDLRKMMPCRISGSLAYKPFKEENGHIKHEAKVIISYIDKIEYNRQDELLLNSVDM